MSWICFKIIREWGKGGENVIDEIRLIIVETE